MNNFIQIIFLLKHLSCLGPDIDKIWIKFLIESLQCLDANTHRHDQIRKPFSRDREKDSKQGNSREWVSLYITRLKRSWTLHGVFWVGNKPVHRREMLPLCKLLIQTPKDLKEEKRAVKFFQKTYIKIKEKPQLA